MCHYIILSIKNFGVFNFTRIYDFATSGSKLITSQIFNLKKLISTTIRSSGSCTISPLSGLLSALYSELSHRVAHSVTTPYYVCNYTYHNTQNYYQNTRDLTHTRCALTLVWCWVNYDSEMFNYTLLSITLTITHPYTFSSTIIIVIDLNPAFLKRTCNLIHQAYIK